MIEINKVLKIIQNQFVNVMVRDADFYSKYNIILSNEQQFVKEKNNNPNTIYLIVRFSDASLNYGQAVLPVTIRAIGEQNAIECCQKLLLDYAQDFNLKEPLLTDAEGNQIDIGNNFIKQVYTSPAVTTNFNEVFAGFRTLFYVSGTFLIGENSDPIESIIATDIIIDDSTTPPTYYELKFLKATLSYDIQLDAQAYYETGGNTRSVAQTATTTIGLYCYLLNDAFYTKILNVVFRKYSVATDDINTSFTFTIKLKSGATLENCVFKLANATLTQGVGELPQISMTFTN